MQDLSALIDKGRGKDDKALFQFCVLVAGPKLGDNAQDDTHARSERRYHAGFGATVAGEYRPASRLV